MTKGTQQSADVSVSGDGTERTGVIEILYVEDDPGFADLTVTCLQEEGANFSITTAADAQTGLECLTDDVDCVVSDYNMPGKNGLEFFESIRETYPGLPFILFTARAHETVVSGAQAGSAFDYLQKGGGIDTFSELADRIRDAVETQRVQDTRTQEPQRGEAGHQDCLSVNSRQLSNERKCD